MVLLPLNSRRRSKRSVVHRHHVEYNIVLGYGGNPPCSAWGSREALGSSNNSMPTEDSVSEPNERMNVRDLSNSQHRRPIGRKHDHVHCEPLHLSAAEARRPGIEATGVADV